MLSEVFSAFPSVGYVSHFCVFRVLHLPGSTSWFHRLLHVFVGISRLRLLGCAFQDAGGGGGGWDTWGGAGDDNVLSHYSFPPEIQAET